MRLNAQKPVGALRETVEQTMFDRRLRRGSSGVCFREIRQFLALSSANLTRRVLENL